MAGRKGEAALTGKKLAQNLFLELDFMAGGRVRRP